jgi:hypothetical protein
LKERKKGKKGKKRRENTLLVVKMMSQLLLDSSNVKVEPQHVDGRVNKNKDVLLCSHFLKERVSFFLQEGIGFIDGSIAKNCDFLLRFFRVNGPEKRRNGNKHCK